MASWPPSVQSIIACRRWGGVMLALSIFWPGLPAKADVQDFLRGFTINGEAEVPVIGVARNRNSSKYEEYRHIPEEQPSLDELKVDLENKDRSYYVIAQNQEIALMIPGNCLMLPEIYFAHNMHCPNRHTIFR